MYHEKTEAYEEASKVSSKASNEANRILTNHFWIKVVFMLFITIALLLYRAHLNL